MPKSVTIFAGAIALLLAASAHAQDRASNSGTSSNASQTVKVAPKGAGEEVKGQARPAPANERSIATPDHWHRDGAKGQRTEQPYLNKTNQRAVGTPEVAQGKTIEKHKAGTLTKQSSQHPDEDGPKARVKAQGNQITADDDWESPRSDKNSSGPGSL